MGTTNTDDFLILLWADSGPSDGVEWSGVFGAAEDTYLDLNK